MVTLVNDCDVLLEGSGQRANNPLDADIILTLSAPAFHVDTSNNPLPSTITVTAHLISLTGFVQFSATGATVTNNVDSNNNVVPNTCVVAYSSLTGQNCSVTATLTVNGQTFTRSITFGKVSDGAAGGNGTQGPAGNQYAQALLYQWSTASTLALPNGTSGYTWATGLNTTYSGNDGWSTTVPANPGTPGIKLYVATATINAPGGTASTIVSYTSSNTTVQAWTQNGNNGVNTITGLLTNEATTLAATSAGVVSDFSSAGGTFKVYDGTTDRTGTFATYTVVSQTGCTVAINASGVYSVSAMSADSATATLQAVYSGVTLQKTLSLAKSKAGTTGTAAYVVVSTTSQVFSRANAASTFSPASVVLTATPYGGAATYQWQYWTGSAWTNVASSGTSSTYTVASGDFTDTQTYRVQATIGGTVYTDQMTIIQVTGGTNGVSGVQSATATIYQWAATIPSGPVGSATYTWSGVNAGTFGAAPTNWNLTPGNAPSPGMTLWAAKVQINDAATSSTTNFNWTNASITAVGYAGTNGSNGTPGAPAAYVVISTPSQVFSRATSAASFAPASITLTATPYGGTATYQWQYWTGTQWQNVASNGTSSTYTAASGDFTDARTYRVQATIGGTAYTDQVTLVQVTGGANGANGNPGTNAITGFLTNESVTLAADNSGNVASFTSASGTYKLFDGIADKTGNAAVTYSVASQTSCTVSITSAGAYSVSAMTADTASAVLQAVYSGVTIPQTLSLAKARAGAPGTNGNNGTNGASYVTAYCASSTGSATSAPNATPGKSSLPATDSGGITGAWSPSVPTLTAGQYLYQVDGIYDPTTDKITWSIPYWSSLKVGSLSAITGNMGALTAGQIDLGSAANSWHVDPNGNMWAGATLMADAPFSVSSAGVLTAKSGTFSGNLSAAGGTFAGSLSAPTGTLGSLHINSGGGIHGGAYTSWSSPAAGGGTGWYIGPEGFTIGNYNDGRYVTLYQSGDIEAPGFRLTNKQLTLTNPLIVGASFSNQVSASLSGGIISLSLQNGINQPLGSRQVTPVNGKGPYKIIWTISGDVASTVNSTGIYMSGSDTDTVTFSGSGTNIALRAVVTATVTDSSGFSASASLTVTARFGSV